MWHWYCSMFEKQSIELGRLPPGVADDYQVALLSAIRRCYLELGEKDTWMALKSDTCVFPDLKRAASLDICGQVNKALDAYNFLIHQATAAHEQFNGNVLSDMELSFVEDRWISLHRETCQWAVLSELAEGSGLNKLRMECAWKTRDWES